MRPVFTSVTTTAPESCCAHRALRALFEVHVHREAQIAPRDRLLAARVVEDAVRVGARAVAAARVDDALLPAPLPAQVALPGVLDARGADAVSHVVAERIQLLPLLGRELVVPRGAEPRERLGVDLGDVAEEVRAEAACRGSSGRASARRRRPGARSRAGGARRRCRAGGPRGRGAGASRGTCPRRSCRPSRMRSSKRARSSGFTRSESAMWGHESVSSGGGSVRRAGARHDAAGDDVGVVGGAARGEDAPLGVADHAARGGEGDAADDVLVRDRAVGRAADDLQLEEADRDAQEGEEDDERHPLVALAELSDVGARDEKIAHSRLPRSRSRAPSPCGGAARVGRRAARPPPSRARAAASSGRAREGRTRRARRSRGAPGS